MSKNIVIFADGTAQEGGTNVSKLHYMIEDRTPQQLVLYVPGVGTEQNRVAGNIGGMGISRYMQECYDFINNNYMVGDKIFLFGFSRGATTIVSLTKFIYMFGLLPRRPDIFKKAYKIYKILNPKRYKLACEWFLRQKYTIWCKIKFVGLFDAVASLGLPFNWLDHIVDGIFPHRFHLRDRSFPRAVENLYHALAIDEERFWFQPLLSDPPTEEIQNHNQVWFCGSHSDIGGAYFESGLSDIPLLWMLHKAKEHGLLVNPHHHVQLNQNPNDVMHNPCIGLLSKFYPKKVRSWNVYKYGKLKIHESVFKRTLNKRNHEQPRYDPWIFDNEYDIEPWNRCLPTEHGTSTSY